MRKHKRTRKFKLTPAEVDIVVNSNLKPEQLAVNFGVSVRTIARIKKRGKENEAN